MISREQQQQHVSPPAVVVDSCIASLLMEEVVARVCCPAGNDPSCLVRHNRKSSSTGAQDVDQQQRGLDQRLLPCCGRPVRHQHPQQPWLVWQTHASVVVLEGSAPS